MRSEWQEQTLNDLGRIVTGKTPSSQHFEYYGGDLPFVTPTDMDGRRLIDSTGRYLTEEGAASVVNSHLPPGSIMVSCIGSDMGKAVLAGKNCVTNQQINSIIVNSGDDPYFVYYNLSLRKAEIHGAASGSAQPILNKTAFGKLRISLPPVGEQRAIARIFGALDDKIELNRRMNDTLEEMAQAIFKSWFVDLDPVRAKSEGQKPDGMGASVAALFPEKLYEIDGNEVPEGWEVRPLSRVAHFLNGVASQKYPPESQEQSLPVIKISELRKGFTESSGKANSKIDQKYIVDDGDVIFSWSGSLELILWGHGCGVLNQHLFKVTSQEFPKWFYYFWTKQHLLNFRRIAADKATTMGHIQRHHLTEAQVFIPPPILLNRAHEVIAPMLDKIIGNQLENRTLVALRDTLLPKLISGEIRVAEAEREVKEVL